MSYGLKKVAVLMGGPSAEREVSLRSGAAVAEALRTVGHNVVDVVVEGKEINLPDGVDMACIMLHGGFGEDGELQELLDQRGIPYTGSGAHACRIAFDKIEAKKIFEREGIPTPAWQIISDAKELKLEYPVIVKPPRQGSTIGVTWVNEASQLAGAIQTALEKDEPTDSKSSKRVLVESLIRGRELTVAILGDRALPVIEIVVPVGVYDYENKYKATGSQHLCPAPLDPTVTKHVQQVAVAAHRALGCAVWSRVDIMLDEQNQPHVLEVNTVPGMTATSLVPDAAKAIGMTFPELCDQILKLSQTKTL